MADAVVLGELELTEVTQLWVEQERKLTTATIPGWDGDLVQDQGAAAVLIRLHGVDYGKDAGAKLESIRQAASSGTPLDFTASAALAAGVRQVLVKRFGVHQQGGRQNTYTYELDLIQYVEPPAPGPGDFDAGFLDGLKELTVDGVTGDLAGFADNLGNPMAEAMAGIDDAMKAVGEVVEMADDIVDKVKAVAGLEKLVSALGGVLKKSA